MHLKTGQACAILAAIFSAVLFLSASRDIVAVAPKETEDTAQETIVLTPCVSIEESLTQNEQAPEPVGKYESIASSISDKDKALTALTIYHESRGESYEGQRAVAEVIFNRTLSERWPNNVGEVLYQKGQFACSGVLTTSAIREPGCLAAAFEVMEDVLQEKEYALPAHYCFFQTKKPRTEDYIKIGNHYFY